MSIAFFCALVLGGPKARLLGDKKVEDGLNGVVDKPGASKPVLCFI